MRVEKVVGLGKRMRRIEIKVGLKKEVYRERMVMGRDEKIGKVFEEEFWVRG